VGVAAKRGGCRDGRGSVRLAVVPNRLADAKHGNNIPRLVPLQAFVGKSGGADVGAASAGVLTGIDQQRP
jgi:hypothetical protein